jgi:phage shock protein A
MQESVARSLESVGSLTAPGTTPTLDEVRDKIEKRYAVALGRADLAAGTVEGRRLEVQKASLDMAGSSRLEEIRASLHAEQLGAGTTPPAVGGSSAKAVTAGDPVDQLESTPAKESEQA